MKKVKFDFDATKQNIFVNQNAAVPVGAPVDQSGAVANNGNAIGIVIGAKKQVISGRFVKNLVVMVAGYCDIIDAQEIWGDEYSAEAIAAMSDIVFCDDHKIGGGGGWPADLPKPSVGGYGYTELGNQTVITWDGDTSGLTEVAWNDRKSLYKVSGLTAASDAYDGCKIVFAGEEYTVEDIEKDDGATLLFDATVVVVETAPYTFGDKTFPETGTYFTKMSYQGEYLNVTSFTYGGDTIHKIDEKYLPSGGAMVVEVDYDGEQFVSTKTVNEVKNAMLTMPVIGIAKINGEFIGVGIFTWLCDGEGSGFDSNSPMVTAAMYRESSSDSAYEILPLIAVTDGEFVINA